MHYLPTFAAFRWLTHHRVNNVLDYSKISSRKPGSRKNPLQDGKQSWVDLARLLEE